MQREEPRTLEYQSPQTQPDASKLGENICLFGVFALYAAANFFLVTFSHSGRSLLLWLFAFVVPLPVALVGLVGAGRFLATPPLFSARGLWRSCFSSSPRRQ